jgi:hypothetical protein
MTFCGYCFENGEVIDGGFAGIDIETFTFRGARL